MKYKTRHIEQMETGTNDILDKNAYGFASVAWTKTQLMDDIYHTRLYIHARWSFHLTIHWWMFQQKLWSKRNTKLPGR